MTRRLLRINCNFRLCNSSSSDCYFTQCDFRILVHQQSCLSLPEIYLFLSHCTFNFFPFLHHLFYLRSYIVFLLHSVSLSLSLSHLHVDVDAQHTTKQLSKQRVVDAVVDGTEVLLLPLLRNESCSRWVSGKQLALFFADRLRVEEPSSQLLTQPRRGLFALLSVIYAFCLHGCAVRLAPLKQFFQLVLVLVSHLDVLVLLSVL